MLFPNRHTAGRRCPAETVCYRLLCLVLLPLALSAADGIPCDPEGAQRISPGDSMACELPAGAVQQFQFTAQPGATVLIQASARRNQPCIQLMNPGGAKAAENCAGTARVSTVVSSAGEWSIRLSEYLGEPLRFTLSLEQFPVLAPLRPLAFGQTIRDTLEPAGELDRYDFEVSAPASVLARCRVEGGICCLELRDSRGADLQRGCTGLAEIRASLPAAGVFSLLLYDFMLGERPAYSLTLDQISPAPRAIPVRPDEPLPGTFTDLAEAHVYQFQALQHYVYSVRAFTSTPPAGACIEVYNSNDLIVRRQCSQQEMRVWMTAPRTGSYTVVLTPYSEPVYLPLGYALSVEQGLPPAEGATSLQFGRRVAASLEPFGDEDPFVVKGTRHDRITLDLQPADAHHALGFILLDAFGKSRRLAGSGLRLRHSGTYALLISEGSYIAGGRPLYPKIDYSLQMNCAGTCSSTGLTISRTLEFPLGLVREPYPIRRLSPSGGTPPYRWRVSAGPLPPGLVLDEAMGTLSGTPSGEGVYRPRFELADRTGQFTSLEATIRIVPKAVRLTAKAGFDASFCRDERCFFRGGGAGGGGRGTNVAVMDAATGVVLDVRNFPTWDPPTRNVQIAALVAYLKAIPIGNLVMVATGDATGFGPSDDPASEPHATFEELGSHLIRDYDFRNAWAMIFIKGHPLPLAEDLVPGEWPDLTIDTWLDIPVPACSYALQPMTASVAETAASGEVSVTASHPYCFWEAISNQAWVHLEDTIAQRPYGMFGGRFRYSVAANPSTEPRTAKIMVENLTFDLSQGAAACVYVVTPSERSIGPEATRVDIEVWTASNCSWRVGPPIPSWITVLSGESSAGNGVVRLAVAANDTATARSATIKVAGRSVTITQPSRCRLSLLPNNRFLGIGAGGGSFTVVAPAICPWTASVQAGARWLRVTPESGMGGATVQFTVAENADADARMGRIQVGDGAFSVTQAGARQNDPACISPPPGLTRWYAADGHAADLSGAGFHAFAAGPASYGEGLVGFAFSLDGRSYYRAPDTQAAAALGPFTWESWIMPLSDLAPFAPIVKATTGRSGYALELSGNNVVLWLYTSEGRWQSSGAASLRRGEWNHVAGVFDGTHLHIYVGGERRGMPVAIRGVPVPPGSDIYIGHDPSNASRFFRGSIDELAMYARALSDEEIRLIARAGRAGKCKPELAHGVDSIVSGADFGPHPLAPGAIASIFGRRFVDTPAPAERLPLPNSLGGVSVTVNGVNAPLYFAGPTQLNVQIPYDTDAGEAALAVHMPGRDLMPVPFAVTPSAPAIFGSRGRCLAYGAAGVPNGADAPAAPGSQLSLYFTGQGAVRPDIATGAAPVSTGARPVLATSVTVGGQQATITYVGLTAGAAGVAQVNFTVPELMRGAHAVSIRVGESTSQPCSVFLGGS